MELLNMSVGQTDLHPAIREQLLTPLVTPAYFSDYKKIQREAEVLAADILETKQTPAIMLGLGRTGLECGLHNLLPVGGKLLCIDNGTWGRFSGELGENLGASVTFLSGDPGKDIDLDRLGEVLQNDRYDLVSMVNCETNTGALYDLAAVRQCLDRHSPDTLLFVDGISTFGGVRVRFDEWQLDCYVGGSQKCLNAPQGTPVICYSERALKHMAKGSGRPMYHTFANATRPSYLLVRGLCAVFRSLMEEGLSEVYRRHTVAAAAVRAGVAAAGLSTFVRDVGIQSPTVTRLVFDADLTRKIEAARAVGGMDADSVTQTMMHKHGVVIGEDRIGTMGHFAREEFVVRAIHALALTLIDLGRQADPNLCVAASRAVFASS